MPKKFNKNLLILRYKYNILLIIDKRSDRAKEHEPPVQLRALQGVSEILCADKGSFQDNAEV